MSPDLVQQHDEKKQQQQLPYLDRLNYTLALLGIYLKHANLTQTDNNELILSPTASVLFTNANWFYLFNSALLVEQYYRIDDLSSCSSTDQRDSTARLVNSIGVEFQNIFYSNDGIFFTKLLNVLIETNQFEVLFDHVDILLQLNHLSFFLTRLVDMAMLRFAECSRLLQTLNQFSQRLIDYSINLG